MHADYSQRGALIRVSLFDDRIEIENLGVVRDTTHRDLLELMKWGILVRQGSGRRTYYVMKGGTSNEEIIRYYVIIIRFSTIII